MGRFSVGFRRKSTIGLNDANDNAVPPSPSFRVMERPDAVPAPQVNARYSQTMHAPNQAAPISYPSPQSPIRRKPTVTDNDDNMFAGMTGYRGSNLSNTTKGTSTDNSSRHSNASTAPSSADMAHQTDETRNVKTATYETQGTAPSRGASTKSISASLFKASRTFSFGSKKGSVPPPRDEPPVPDLPPMLNLAANAGTTPTGTANGPASPPHAKPGTGSTEGAPIDLGSDFSAMFDGMQKRESVATVTNRAPVTQGSHHTATPTSPVAEDRAMSFQKSPTRQLGDFQLSSPRTVEDDDAKLLQDSVSAMRFLNQSSESASPSSYRGQSSSPASPIASSFHKEDNMFDETSSRFARVTHRYVPRSPVVPKNRVMTPAQFEKYRQDKELGASPAKPAATVKAVAKEDEDDEEVNYDDEEDEHEKKKQQTLRRRQQEAQMANYRQQKMRVAGEPSPAPSRAGMPHSLTTPQFNVAKTPSPNLPGASDEDDDEEVPLALLQANGFPNRNRPASRLSQIGPMRPVQPPSRPASVMGDAPSNMAARRSSTLPAFARNLPQDPFASGGRPPLRETVSYHEQQPSPGLLPPGGLVGVIAHEERSRAMRRGSPNIDGGRGHSTSPNMMQQGFDPVMGIPHQMMYQQPAMQGSAPVLPQSMTQMSMGGMPMQMPMMPMMSPSEQAQMQMNQQMQQFMQMQMQFMQMMALNQNGTSPQGMAPSPTQYMATQSMTDLTARHSFVGEPQPERLHPGMRTMSMVQPSSASIMGGVASGAASVRGMPTGYAPSIAPSERSNIGLPGRYRPVSQAIPAPLIGEATNANNFMSGANTTGPEPLKTSRTSANIMPKASAGSDEEDDDQAWAAMKTKREKKRSIWRSRKSNANDLVI